MGRLIPLIALIPLSLGLFCPPEAGAAAPERCNGFAELCDRPYDQVSYVTTHNAFNYFKGNDPQYRFVNQGFSITAQLNAGTRGLMLDVHEYNGFDNDHAGEIWLCHSFCWLGGEPLVDGLTDIANFMAQNPDEVVSIIFESYVDRDDIEAAFIDSGLINYVYAHPLGDPWPTLSEMIQANTRLVVFTDRQGGSPDWHHNVWDYAVETHYSAQAPEDFSCNFNRGDARNDLFIFNHFLTYPLARRSLAWQVNFNPYLIERAQSCWDETGKFPNFVTVDFVTIGDTYEAVDILNGVR